MPIGVGTVQAALVAPSPGRSVLLRAGTGPVLLCIYRKCLLVTGSADKWQFRGEIAGIAVFYLQIIKKMNKNIYWIIGFYVYKILGVKKG